jgi:hypothetical protein
MVGLLFIGTASAVHDEAFELDGNIIDNQPPNPPAVDWDNDIVGVGANGFAAPQTSLPAGFSSATAGPDFSTTIRRGVEVAVTGDDSTFTTNSKDILDISAQWRCVHANNVTDKGDLVNTYAVAYINGAGQLILYFGAEKNDASGTNNLGVWFLQDDDVSCTDTQGGSGTAFTGSHVVGDILVVSEFTNGGNQATIVAYVWDPTNPAAVNNLVLLGSSGRCDQIDSLNLDDRLCAITNVSNQVNPPWKTWDKDTGSLDFIDTQQFYEGAINVTAFGLNPCINTLLTDTRSSVSTTATLYDFALVPFSVCNSKSGTKFNDLDADGTRDAGEPGLSGWTINLYQDTGTIGSYDGEPVFQSDVTDANGDYSFANLLSGNYIVCEVKQATWEQSAPTSAPTGETLVTNCPGPTNGYAFAMSGGDRAGNNFGNFQRGAFRILKNSTKGGPVSTAGAVFSYDGSSVTDNGAGDEDPDVGQVCVSGLTPGDLTVTETSAPPGYGTPVNPGPLTVTVAAGTNCTDNQPTGAGVVTFTDPPLADIQVNFRDGGSGETSATSITCANTGTTADTTPATGWDDSRTHTGIRIDPSPRTITCTIVIDP